MRENRPVEAATEPTLVPGYRHLPGNHCGSTALRNLLAFHGVEISEENFSVYDVREGKIVKQRMFRHRAEALEAAGLSE